MIPGKKTTSRSRRFKLLGDENRLRILEALIVGPANVTTLSERLKLAQSLLSHHLAALRAEGLVTSNRRGKEIEYRIAEGVLGAENELDLGCCSIVLR